MVFGAIIGGIVGAGLLIASIRNAFVGFFLFTAMLYLKPGIFHPVFTQIHITRLVGIVTLLAFLLQKDKRGNIKFLQAAPSKWLATFIFFMGMSLTTSIWKSNTLGYFSNFFKVFIAYILVINLLNTLKRIHLTVWAMNLALFYIALASIHAYYTTGQAAMGSRMFGAFQGALFGDPNDLAMAFILLIPFLFYDLFRKGSFLRKGFQLGMMLIYFWGIVLTQSRGGTLALCVMLLALWWRSRNKFITLILAGLIILVGWQYAPQSYKARVMSISTASENDAAAISRLNAWTAGRRMMTKHVFGVGVGNFGEAFVLYRPINAVDVLGMRRASHNMFIQVGGETGFPGLIVFCCMILSAILSLNKTRKSCIKKKDDFSKELCSLTDATFVSLIGYCAAGVFLSQAYNFVLYYFIGFSVALSLIAMNPQSNLEK